MSVAVAFLSGGRLHVKEGDEPPRTFDSRFGQSVRDRAVRSARKDAWKTTGAPGDPVVLRIAITGVSRSADPGVLLYALDTDEIVGVFSLDPATGHERRLFHSNDRRLRSPSGRPGIDEVVCSILAEGGTANLALMNADGSDLREVTEGESLDVAPSWAPERRQIAYQTAGLGRDREGRVAGMSPFSAQLLDLETGEITPLLEDARFDFLGPRVDSDGVVYAIRRPRRDGPGLLGFLAERAERWSRRKGDEAPGVVPSSWKLVRRRPGGDVEELATGVLAFDLGDDGSLVITNGSAIDQLAPDGARRRLWLGELIEQVVALD
jgi:hypothetical protein